MKKYLLLSALAALTLLFISCPEPLSEDIVRSALDKLPPSITVYSPGSNSTYYADVEFSLKISDDSLSTGDGKGDVASIEFSVSNDDFRGGKINISTSGSVSQESGSDILNYDPASGILDFSFSTIEPSVLNGLLSVNLIVTDRNGNVTEERVTLYENDGPWFDFTVVDEDGDSNVFWPGEENILTGSVANSNYFLTSSSDIYRIEWNISNILIGKLILDEEATYEDPYNPGIELNYFNSSTGLYESIISGYLFSYNADNFIYDPSDGTMSASIYMKDQFMSQGSLSFKLEVEDKSGHVSSESIILSLDLTLPDIGGDNPIVDNIFGYYSKKTGYSDQLTLKCGNSFSDLDITYILESGGHESTFEIPLDTSAAYSNGSAEFLEFDIDSGLLSALLADPSRAETTTLILTAANKDDPTIKTIVGMTLKEDSDGPELGDFSIVCANPAIPVNVDYASDLNTLDVSYEVTGEDLEMGVSSTITVGSATAISHNGTGSKSESLVGTTWSSGESEGFIPVRITMIDHLGNTSEYENTDGTFDDFPDQKVIFYPSNSGNLALSGMSVTLTADDPAFSWDEEKLWARSGEEMRLTFDPGARVIESISGVSIGGIPVSDGDGDNIFISSDTSQADNGSKIKLSYSIQDKAGNLYSATDVNSLITYDDVIPVQGSMTFSYIYDTTPLVSNFLSTEMLDNKMKVTLNGLGSSIDTNYHGFKYKVFNTEYSSFIDTLALASSSVTLDDDHDTTPLSGVDEDTYSVYVLLYDEAGNSNIDDSSGDIFDNFILDLTAPTITVDDFVKTAAGTPSAYPGYAKKGDTISLTFTCLDLNSEGSSDGTSGVEALSDFDVSINGQPVDLTYNDVSKVYTATRVLSSDDNDNDLIPYSIIVEDKAGNTKTLSQDSTITYYATDLEDHIGFAFSGASEEIGNTYWASSGDTVIFSVTPQRDLITFTGTFAEEAIDAGGPVNTGVTKDFSVVMSGADETQLYYSIDTFTDKAGNTCSSSEIPFSKTLYYDSEKPILTDLTISISDPDGADAGVYNTKFLNSQSDNDEVLSINLGGDGKNLDIYYLNYDIEIEGYSSSVDNTATNTFLLNALNVDSGGTKLTDNDGDYVVTVIVSDKAGNTESKTFDIIVDKTLPVIDVTKFDDGDADALRKHYAKDDDTAYLYFTISDSGADQSGIDASSYTYSFAGIDHSGTAEDSTNNWTLSEILDYDVARVAAFDDNVIPFSLTISDLAGNTAIKTNTSSGITALNYYGSPLSLSNLSLTYRTADVDFEGFYAQDDEPFYLDILCETRILDSVVGTFSDDDENITSDTAANTVRILTDTRSNNNTSFQVGFSLTIKDKAGNILGDPGPYTEVNMETDLGVVLIYDSDVPDTNTKVMALSDSGDGINGTYVNGNTSTQVITLDVEEDYPYGYIYTLDNWTTDSGVVAGSSIPLNRSDFDNNGSYTLNAKVVDKAGNTSSEYAADLTFIVDRTAPTIYVSSFSFSALVIDISELNAIADPDLTDADVSLGDPPTGVVTPSVVGDTVTYTATDSSFKTTAIYKFNAPSVIDSAGNASPTTYNLLNGDIAPGLSISSMTLQPEFIQENISTSYKSIRVYNYLNGVPMSNKESVRALSEDTTASELNELTSLKKAQSYSSVPVSFRSGSAAIERSIPERVEDDVSLPSNSVKDAMDRVALNEAEYEAQIQKLMTPELSKERLSQMEVLMEPMLIEAETLTVSATPFLVGAASNIDVVLTADAEEAEKTTGALIYQLMGAVLMALLTLGFVMFLRKMNKT